MIPSLKLAETTFRNRYEKKMAGSRLFKLGSVFERISGLIESKVMLTENIPIWYNIYKRYPPEKRPAFDEPIDSVPIKPIFYPEDNLRAKIHKSVPNFVMDLNAEYTKNITDNCQGLMNEGLTIENAIKKISQHVTIFKESENRHIKKPYSFTEEN